MNETFAAIKGLNWAGAGRALARESKSMARAVAGTGVKGYYLPTAVGAVAGGGISYGNRALDGADGTRGTAASIWKGMAVGAVAGFGFRGISNFRSGGGVGSLRTLGGMARRGGTRVGRAAAFDAEYAYHMARAQGTRFAGPAVDMAGRAYGAAQAGGSIAAGWGRGMLQKARTPGRFKFKFKGLDVLPGGSRIGIYAGGALGGALLPEIGGGKGHRMRGAAVGLGIGAIAANTHRIPGLRSIDLY
jgi:hypothetical protein